MRILILLLLTLIGAHADIIDVTAAEADRKLKADKKIIIIDVRTPAEFKKGHLNEAQNINVKDEKFKDQIGKLDRDTTYLLHCLSGARSARALAIFKELGFKNILHLTPGYRGWQNAKLPTTKD